MSDPLSLVRSAAINGEAFSHADGCYVLGGQKFPEATKTAFKRTLRTSEEFFYSIRDIIFFLENVGLTVAEYRKKVVEQKVTAVVEQDRPQLQDYLFGRIDTCPQIDLAQQAAYKPAPLSVRAPKRPSEPAPASDEAAAAPAEGTEETRHKSKTRRLSSSSSSIPAALTGGQTFMSSLLAQYDLSAQTWSHESAEQDKAFLSKFKDTHYPVHNRQSLLNAAQGVEFSLALKLFNDKVLKAIHMQTQQTDPTAPAPASTNASAKPPVIPTPNAVVGRKKDLLILVPSSLTSLLNIHNALDFLAKGQFTLHNAAVSNDKPSKTRFVRKIEGKEVFYQVLDDAKGLREEDWDRVVAVFVTGQAWQFKQYLYTNPTELLQKVLGFHVMKDGLAADTTVQAWNCKILKINEFKAYVNNSASRDFWQGVDNFVRYQKPNLIS